MTQDPGLGKNSMRRNSTTLAQFEKWIVVTSIRPPTDDVKYMAQMPGWRVVVVGDVKSPGNWSYPNCDFLSTARQKLLNFKINSHLPFKSYARKNIGYLYAVLNGAKYIYETDDDNRPFDDLEGFIYGHRTSGLMYDGQRVFNPYHHFGQSTLWPRGYPLSEIGAVTSKSYWLDSDWTTPTIQQGVVNGDPDVDAVFRLTRKSVTSPINVTFDPYAPPVFVPQGVFSPFNSQNTLFHHRAFWALLIPMTTTFRMCDIWRGYWAQRLMWEIGDRLSFFTANAYQNRSVHSYMEDATDEKDMYFQTEALIGFLTNWTCHSSMSFFQCVLELTTDMADKNFWKHEEIDLTRSWLDDLTELKYPEPNRVIEVLTLTDNDTLTLENYNTFHDDNFNKTKTKVTFIPSEQKDQSVKVEVHGESPAHEAKDILTTMCPNISQTMWTLNNDQYSNYYHDILLVVVFNWPRHYGNVRYLDAMYSKVFPNIVYCGDDAPKFYEQTKSLEKLLSFLELKLEGGYVGYLCAVKAMEINYKVKGYLIMGDDVMFKHWKFFNASKEHFWITYDGGFAVINITKPKHPWPWWGRPIGKAAYDKTMSDITSVTDFPEFVNNASSFQANLSDFTGNPDIIEGGLSDLYYIPASKRHDTMWYMRKFYKYKVFLEIAVPTVIRGLERKDKIVFIKGRSLLGINRVNPFRIYSNADHFFHPMKLTNKNDVTFQDLCRIRHKHGLNGFKVHKSTRDCVKTRRIVQNVGVRNVRIQWPTFGHPVLNNKDGSDPCPLQNCLGPFDDLEGFIYSHRTSGMMYDGQRVFNPYHHSSVTSPINVTFDPYAPPVFVPQGVFSPFNSQNTLFHHRAFLAMLIPMTTTFRMCDIWRGYWAQRLMWEIGDRLSFFTANAYQNRSAHSYMEDATGEKDMYFQTEALIDFLTTWTCHSSMGFFQCILKLTTDMADKIFWKHEEIDMTRSWLDDLTELGYPEPNRVIEVLTLADNDTLTLENYNTFHDDNFNKTKTKVTFIPSEQKDQSVRVEVHGESPAQEAKDILTTMCPNISQTVWTLNNDQYSHYYHDILLVVVFNWPRHYGNVQYLDAMYSKVFPNIVYCGDDGPRFYEQTKPLGKRLSFLELRLEGGYVGYLCAVKAMEMNYNVKGYLIMGDDVMFKHWTFFNASKENFWVTNEGGFAVINITNPKHPWTWWERPIGKAAYDKTISDITFVTDILEFVNNASSFLANLSDFTGNPDIIEGGLSDLYYIPASKRHDTMWYMKKFYKYKVSLEIAVPTVIRGLERKDKIVFIRGRSLWGNDRVNPFRIYSNVSHFFHPMKLTNKNDVTFQDLCRLYVPDTLRHSFGWNCSTI
ncbi:hypothetical protein Btru_077895 [Bulinus truncatus]|nr:hypothetical protein Btru_077895 [Bulinus truncatus]